MFLVEKLKERLFKTQNKIVRLKERIQYPEDLFNFGNSKEKYLRTFHGGLGDTLAFSTLPEEFYKQLGAKTYILKSTKFSNQEIYDLVFGCNPFVNGFKEGPWNAGDPPDLQFKNIENNIIKNVELQNGLIPRNIYPKIYYEPKYKNNLSNSLLVDINSNTIKYDFKTLKKIIKGIKEKNQGKELLKVNFKKNNLANQIITQDYDNSIYDGVIQVENIFDYCDKIASSYGIISLSSGVSYLSSALKFYAKHLKIFCIMDNEWYCYHLQKGIYIFDNVDYVIF